MNTNFEKLFNKQTENQKVLLTKGAYDKLNISEFNDLPIDEPNLCSYHIQQLISEIGEVLDADKRWKNFRNVKYEKENKLEEIADCFIVLMNVSMFSDFNANDVYNAIEKKLNVVSERIKEV